MRLFSIFILISVILLTASCYPESSGSPDSNDDDCCDDESNEFSYLYYSKMIIGSDCQPRIVYNSVDEELNYVWKNENDDWTSEMIKMIKFINNDFPSFEYGNKLDMVLDSEDNPYICYLNDGLYLASKRDELWNTDQIDLGIYYNKGSCSIGLDAEGGIHIATVSEYGLNHFFKSNEKWETETIENSVDYFKGCSMEIIGHDIHIFYEPTNQTHIRHAYLIDQSWTKEDIVDQKTDQMDTYVDNNDTLYFCSSAFDEDVVTVLYTSGESWENEQIILDNSYACQIANDTRRYPLLNYVNYVAGDGSIYLYLKKKQGWKRKYLFSDTGKIDGANVVYDENGKMHLNFYAHRIRVGTLYYATNEEGTLDLEPYPIQPAEYL